MATMDYEADYREAQESGHHEDCDGWYTAHRVEIRYTRCGNGTILYEPHCEECGKLGAGSSSHEIDARRMAEGHSQEVRCDLRCQHWH